MNKTQVEAYFRKEIEKLVQDGYDRYLEEENIPSRLLPQSTVERIVYEQMDLGFSEFWEEEVDNLDGDNYTDKVSDYVNENYDADFITNKIEDKVDVETIKAGLLDELALRIINTEPYGYAPRSYWIGKARLVDSLKELGTYADGEDLTEFVEKYAPDWEEIAKENQEY